MRDILYLYWNEDSNAQNARFKIKVKIEIIYEFPRQKCISIQNLNMTRQIARICIVLENTQTFTLTYTSILEFVYFSLNKFISVFEFPARPIGDDVLLCHSYRTARVGYVVVLINRTCLQL